MRTVGFLFFMLFGLLSLDLAHAENISQNADNTSIEIFSDGKNEIIAKFSINDGWHIYYQNPGEIGKPTFVENLNPENTLQTVDISVPTIEKAYDIMDEYIYRHNAYFKLYSAQAKNLKFAFNFLECADVCKPQKIVFEIDNLPKTGAKTWEKITSEAGKTFPLNISADFEKKHNRIRLKLTDENIKAIPEKRDIISDENLLITSDNDDTLITWQNIDEQNKLNSLLIVTPNKSYNAKINYDYFDWTYFFYIALTAFLGGIILNAMPCVFPILSLKIFGLIKNNCNKPRYGDALAYTFGVLSSFWILAAILDILKEGGTAIGWGFQLQSPVFVSLMMILFFFLFLYMVEALPFPELANDYLHKLSRANSFMTGFFAVLIAGPCTGPFMGAAIGYAFMQTDIEMYAVFTFLALGYALPFALAEIYPHFLQKILPKPGAWMAKLKVLLAIPVLLTCLWLASVLVAQIYAKDGINKNNLNWRKYDTEAIQAEINSGKKIFIDFTAEWCLTCMFNEKTRLNNKEFADFVKNNNIELFKADLTESNEEYNQALNSYGRDGIPVYIYYEGEKYRILPIFFDLEDLTN